METVYGDIKEGKVNLSKKGKKLKMQINSKEI